MDRGLYALLATCQMEMFRWDQVKFMCITHVMSKIGNVLNDLSLAITLNCQKRPVCTEYLPPTLKFYAILLHHQHISKCKVVKNWKRTVTKVPCIHWLLVLIPGAQIFVHFAPDPVVFEPESNQESEMHQMDLNWP